MTLDCGWVELLPVDERRAVGRAHLFLDRMPSNAEPWRGRLDSLRAAPGETEVRPGFYLLRFANSLQSVPAQVDITDGAVTVCGEDDEIPAPLAELAEG